MFLALRGKLFMVFFRTVLDIKEHKIKNLKQVLILRWFFLPVHDYRGSQEGLDTLFLRR